MLLGLLGLIPQILAIAAALIGGEQVQWAAMSIASHYSAGILAFLGGTWWGLAAVRKASPAWIYLAGALPVLLAVTAAVPRALGGAWPGPAMILLGTGLIAALIVDLALLRQRFAPEWWMQLRLPLSIGMAVLCFVGATIRV